MRRAIIVVIGLLLCAFWFILTMVVKGNQPHARFEIDFEPKLFGIWICGCVLIVGVACILIWKKRK
jgi:hypothetical protein